MMKATPKAGIFTSLLLSGGWGSFSFGGPVRILTHSHPYASSVDTTASLLYGIIPWRGDAGWSVGNQSLQLLDDDDDGDKASGSELSEGLFGSDLWRPSGVPILACRSQKMTSEHSLSSTSSVDL